MPRTVRVSVSNAGEEGNGDSFRPSISTNGRWVAFSSAATNLVQGDNNDEFDIFVHDLRTKKNQLISVSTGGEQGNGLSYEASISANGQRVAFASYANNLVTGDNNQGEFPVSDIFVHNLRTGSTTLVSVSSSGQQGNSDSISPSISADGRWVVFESRADNLVPSDANGESDVFIHNLRTGETRLVSVNGSGDQASGASSLTDWGRTISPHGHRVVFSSVATNLVPGDHNGWQDVFVHNLRTGKTELASVSSSGEQADNSSDYASISATGRVAFCSGASNLDPEHARGGVFVHDLHNRTTEKVSVTSSGGEIEDYGRQAFSCYPWISPNGRWVAFMAYLDGHDVVHVHDMATGETVMMTDIFGQMTNLASQVGDLSNRSVAFDTDSDNLVPGGDIYLNANDVFVHYLLPHH
ncbi:MAG TPA: hypothetical protein VHV50_00160 [Actinomycetota bacterium]|nr:hypothetical protein [Actinomycetota bacterium]